VREFETPQDLAWWMTTMRPLLVAAQDRTAADARRLALTQIRRTPRKRPA
jgi:hypothetical protein